MKWALVLLMMLPIAGAIDDVAGDVSVEYHVTGDETIPAQDVSDASRDWFPYMDITGHGILDETDYEIGFWIEIAGDEPPNTALHNYDFVDYMQYFEFHGEPFAIHWEHYRIFDFMMVRVMDMAVEPPSVVTYIRDEVVPSDDKIGYIAYLPKDSLRDSNHVPARAGDEITFTGATASEGRGFGFTQATAEPPVCVSPTAIPDVVGALKDPCGFAATDEASGGVFELTEEPPRTSDVLLESPAPFRGSNGLATTYSYELRAINFAEEEKTFLVDFSAIDPKWTLYAPDALTIPAGESIEFAVAIGVPFAHQHGEIGIATVTLLEKGTPANADGANLYVIWEDPPQPGGHHDTLYFHNEGFFNFMNTSAAPVSKFGYGQIEPQGYSSGTISAKPDGNVGFNDNTAYWRFGLRPRLALGLDFDTSKEAQLELDISFPEAVAEAEVSASLYIIKSNGESITIGEGEASLTPNSEGVLAQIAMEIYPEADLLPYDMHSNLYLEVDVQSTGTAPEFSQDFATATISEEFSFLKLPLIDYHDVIDQELLDSISSLGVSPTLSPWNYQNPGKTAAFAFEVINSGSSSETIAWTVEGQSGEWAQVTPGESSVGANSNATVFVEAAIPESTVPGIYEFLLFGESKSGEQVFTKFAVEVTTDEILPDQAGLFEELRDDALSSAETPPMALGIILAALALLVRRRR